MSDLTKVYQESVHRDKAVNQSYESHHILENKFEKKDEVDTLASH